MDFKKVLDGTLKFGVALKVLPQKGNLVYEYNPFRNYRLDQDMYEYKGNYYTLKQLEDKFNIKPDQNNTKWKIGDKEILASEEQPELKEAGEVVDFVTNELSFDLEHPVDILPQYSYDDSVNLIINDGKNTPRLINSRFSAIGKNQYQIVDRKGSYDTNLYDQGIQFNSDTSLYKQVLKIPKLKFLGTTSGGNLSVGNYHFYFRYSDADGNESDFVAESGLVSIFMGDSPQSVRTGFRDENSYKIVNFILSNIDLSYPYVKVYYTKSTSDIHQNAVVSAFQIEKNFGVNKSGVCCINITGFEEKKEITIDEINPTYQLYDNADTQAICQNMLFLSNVNQPDLDYDDIADASLYFFPYLETKTYDVDINQNYEVNSIEQGYTDVEYIYNYVGYWNEELYRLGIVYILENNTLSPVFNIRGAGEINFESTETNYTFPEGDSKEFDKERTKRVSIDEDGFIINKEANAPKNENAYGVIQLKEKDDVEGQKQNILSIGIKVQKEVLQYLKDTYKIRGFFFVRQKRIPITLCQALTIGIDKESRTPVLPIDVEGQIKDLLPTSGKICVNKKTGEVADGDTTVQKPRSAGQKLAIGLKKHYGKASEVYANNDDWVVYERQNIDKSKKYFIAERFLTDAQQIDHNFIDHLYFLEKDKYVDIQGAICPEYDINSPYYNNIFNSDKLVVQEDIYQPEKEWLQYDSYAERNLYNNKFTYSQDEKDNNTCRVIGVEDNAKLVAIGETEFSARAGEAEEAFRYEYLGEENKITQAYNLLRGSFGPYLGITGNIQPNRTINIKIPGFNQNNMRDYFIMRISDKSPYYAISDRFDIDNVGLDFEEEPQNSTTYLKLNKSLYRGDCYICQFTHRLNRNFQDPTTPINDKIVDSTCWATSYSLDKGILDKEKFDGVNLGDVNAVKLGMWITSTYKSSVNLNIRTLDDSIADEVALTGHPRGFFPYNAINASGNYKTPEALCYNAGLEKSLSERYNFEVPDVPAIRNNFATRIAYSDIQVKDAFKNGFRVFRGTHYRDYPITYGAIVKLVELYGNLIAVCEHGILNIPVNERTIAAEGAGGLAYINTSNVLPENPKVISDTFGTQWEESVIKTDYGIYGVDTVGKKIWFTDGQNFKCISDFQVQEFLNQNITLQERELTPIIGVRNVKTHYNKFKKDVMFTFYDNLYGFNEKCWNLCYNEILQKFITFYSWIPSYSENIYNTYFSFDRNTSKWIAKLGISKEGSDFAQNIVISNNVIKPDTLEIGELKINPDLLASEKGEKIETTYTFEIVRDNFKYCDYFEIKNNKIYLKEGKQYKDLCTEYYIREKDGKEVKPDDAELYSLDLPISYDQYKRRKWLPYEYQPNSGRCVIFLNIRAKLTAKVKDDFNNIKELEEYQDNYNSNYSTYAAGYLETQIALIPEYNKQFLTTDFWKHGQSGIIDLKDTIKPANWYGKQHPFEFEFVVNDEYSAHKIFDNLVIISNSAEPESFHYEIVGDCFDFAWNKKNMYIRQEAIKEVLQYNGVDITFDPKYKDLEQIEPKSSDGKTAFKDIKKEEEENTYLQKQTIFPAYYSRQDTVNEIEDYYKQFSSDKHDYNSLSGAEIVRNLTIEEYYIWNHAKAVDITNCDQGRLRGNMQYKEDKWNVQINPINVVYKNEKKSDWKINDQYKVPAEYNLFRDVYTKTINTIPDFDRNLVGWNIDNANLNKEIKPKDKWIKIRIRYKGDKLAIINAIQTLYSISYA